MEQDDELPDLGEGALLRLLQDGSHFGGVLVVGVVGVVGQHVLVRPLLRGDELVVKLGLHYY